MKRIPADEWRLIVLAAIAFFVAVFLIANEPTGGESAVFYMYFLLAWVGIAVFASGRQGIPATYQKGILLGGVLGLVFIGMHIWQPAIFRLNFPEFIFSAQDATRILVIVILAPIGEELAFRLGLFQIVLRQQMNFFWAAIISSAAFAFTHVVAYGAADYTNLESLATGALFGAFTFGLAAAWLTEQRKGDITAALIMHGVVNAFLLISPFVVFSQ